MDVRRLAALCVLALLASAPPAHAERLILKSYTTADGLAHDSVQRIVVDPRGFVWLCTGDGLSRFDGQGFTNYGIGDGLPAALVHDLLPTPDGHYWIATSAGLVRFDPAASPPARFTVYQPGPDPWARHVTSLLQDRQGIVWVGTWDGLYRVSAANGEPVVLATVDLGLPSAGARNAIWSLMADHRNALWIGTANGLYRRAPDGQLDQIALSSIADSSPVHATYEDRDGQIWVATRESGLFQLRVDPVSHRAAIRHVYSTGRGLPTDWISTIVQTADGMLWVGSNLGLFQVLPVAGADTYRIRVYSTAEGMTDYEIRAIAEDAQRNLWLGTNHAGVAKLWQRGLTAFGPADGQYWSSSMATTRAGDVIAITTTAEPGDRWWLNRFDGTRFVAIKPRLPGVTPGWGWSQTLLEDHRGDWWLGTAQGLYRFSNLRTIDDIARASPAAIYTVKDGLSGPTVLRIFEDSAGDVWVGTIGPPHGLSRWQRTSATFQHYTEADGLPPRNRFYVSSFAEDRAGHVWIGFSGLGGLARHQDGRFVRFTGADGAPAGGIANLLTDSLGRLWAATDRAGIARVDAPAADRPTFAAYTTAQGLSSNWARAVVEDGWGRIYVGTGRGIDRIDPRSGAIRHYTSAEGMPTGAGSAMRDREGALWFRTPASLVRFVPERDRPQRPPAILVTALHVDARPQPISAVGEQALRLNDLPPGGTQIQIEFVALGFTPGDGVRYQYRLEGADQVWSPPSAERVVTYARLSPGSYRFLVRAVNADGIVSTAPASVAFTVLAPIWRRWWFITLAALAVSAAVYALHRVRVTRLLAVARMRTSIATDLHDDIGANLTRIAVLSELARRQQPPSGAGGDGRLDVSLASIGRIARESVSGMGDIVWAISPDRDNLTDLVRKMRAHVEDVFAARNLGVVFNAPAARDALRLPGPVRRDLYLIFKEAVNNAARHAGCSIITIDLSVDRARLCLAVTDDGAGFDTTGTSDGHGLVSMRRRARRLGTELEVDSGVGQGTTIRLTVAVAGLPR